MGGRLVLQVTKRAWAARYGTRKRRLRHFEAASADLARCLRQEPRPTAWGGARRELAAQKSVPSPQRAVRALWAVGWLSTGRSAHGPRATGLKRDGYVSSKPQLLTWRGVCARRFGQRRGVERAASWPHRQPRQVRSAQCMRCGRLAVSPRGDARTPRATGLERDGYDDSKPQPPTWRGVCARSLDQQRGVERVRVDRADNRAKSAARSACVVGGRLVLHVTKRAQAARHETIKRRLRHFEAASADLAWFPR